MADTETEWAERRARLAHRRVVESRRQALHDHRSDLVAKASLEDVTELGFVDSSCDSDEAGHSQVLRAAVNDLQHRLLTADPQADVHGFALERLMTAAQADRACAFANRTGRDGRVEHELYAEAVVSAELRLLDSDARLGVAYEDFIPGLFERLASGAPFNSRAEFLPRPAAARLEEQSVEALLLLPLFVGGAFHGFLRLDRCDRGWLWSQAETDILVSAAGSISAAMERQRVMAKLVQRSHELAALLATSRSITSSIDYDVVLREVACAAAGALGCPQAVIWEYSGRGDTATYRALYQRDPRPGAAESLVGTTFYGGNYPGGMRAVREGIVAQQSFSDESLSEADRQRMTEQGEKTWLGVPLVYGEEVLGMMILTETERERRFSPDEVRMAQAIAEQAAAGLHNARLHRREEDQHRWLAALAEASRVIASRLDRGELLRDVARLATEALLVDGAHVYEWDEARAGFELRATAGEGSTGQNEVEAAITGALRNGQLVLRRLEDAALSPHEAARMAAAGEEAVVWVPFTMEDETLGAMRLVSRSRQGQFGDGELSFARALGEQAAIALNNALLYGQIEDQATKDGLTGLANHRHFYDRLAEELDRAQRLSRPLALLMVDIDDFKKLNDTYGHPAGDEVLRQIGRLLREELRDDGDLAARYGGEEFCVILPNAEGVRQPGATQHREGGAADRPGDKSREATTPRQGGGQGGAVRLAVRLRRRIAAHAFPIGPGGAPVRATVSIGIASFPASAASMEALVGRADKALYVAKRAGKDRVAVC
jgi:GGDEF domain-containing protein